MPKLSRIPDPAAAADLPPDLERRIAAIERQPDSGDLDPVSWFWLIVFGVVLPAALLLLSALA